MDTKNQPLGLELWKKGNRSGNCSTVAGLALLEGAFADQYIPVS